MAVYQAVSVSHVGYFAEFKNAENFIRKKSLFNGEDNIYLLMFINETRQFIEDSKVDMTDYFMYEECDPHSDWIPEKTPDQPLRDLTEEELNDLPDRLYTVTISNHPVASKCSIPSVYINEESLLKYYRSYYYSYSHLFDSFGPMRENYALYMLYGRSYNDVAFGSNFKDVLQTLKMYQERYKIGEVEVNNPEYSRITDYISLTTKDKLHTAFQMLKEYVEENRILMSEYRH